MSALRRPAKSSARSAPSEHAGLRVKLLGGFETRLATGSAVTLPTRKAQALLAYLAVRPGHAHARDKLAAFLWADRGDAQARDSLRHTLVELRKVFPERSPSLIGEGRAVTLDPAAVDVDVVRFEALVKTGTAEDLAQAAEVYQGDFLEGFVLREPAFEEWLVVERERLRELALGALRRLLDHQAAAGASEAGIRTAQRLVALDATQEVAHRALMRMYVQQGRRAAALRQYQTCVDVLQRELGTEPEAETRQLYQDVLRRRAWASAPADTPSRRVRPPTLNVATPAPELPAHDTALVGREAELAELRGALDTMTWGGGRVALVVGEAGIGKTRLIAELAALALASDARVLLGRSYESVRILPFGPWVDALRTGRVLAEIEQLDGLDAVWRNELGRLFPELGERRPADAGGAEDYLRLFEAMAQLIGALARTRPVVVVLEDLHWADEMSLRFLSFLGHRVAAVPVFIVATAREEDVPDAPALARTLAELRRESVTRTVALGPLSREAIASLVGVLGRPPRDATAMADLEDRVWRASEGNPFVAVETLRALEQGTAATASGLPVPERVREIVTQRLARLGPGARELATVAAIVGSGFDFSLLEGAAGVGGREAAEAMEELVRRHVLHAIGDRIDFVHERIRAVILETVSPFRRRMLHGHIGRALEELYTTDLSPHYAALARHYREADDHPRAIEYFRKAAGRALTTFAHREAALFLEEALAASRHLPDTPPTLAQSIDLCLELRTALVPLGEFERILRHLHDAEALARKLGDPRRLGWTSAYLSHYFWVAGHATTARTFAETAQAAGETLADLSLRIVASVYLTAALVASGDYRRAEQSCLDVVPLLDAAEKGERFGLVAFPGVMARSYLAWALANRGAFDDGIAQANEAVRASEVVGHPESVAFATAYLALVHIAKGEVAQAISLLERSVALCREWKLMFFSALVTGWLGHAYAGSGRVAEGLGLLQEALPLFESMRVGAYHAFVLVHLGEASARASRLEDGLVYARRALTLARERGERGTEAWALRLLGELAALGHPFEPHARDHYQGALELANELGMRPLAGHCHLGLGMLYVRIGAPREARAELIAAADLYRGMAMASWLRQAETHLVHVG